MEKITAELDALVFNYDVVEDDSDMTEIKEKEDKPNSDTSFDENQNPKGSSQPISPEETPKKTQDSIVPNEVKVLFPKKLHVSTEAAETRRLESANPAFSIQNAVLESSKANQIDADSSGAKRLRDLEETKDVETPKFKKIKAVNLEAAEISDSVTNKGVNVETKGLESVKPKRGRPIGSRKIKSVDPTLLQLSKAQKTERRVLGIQKPKAEVQANHVDLPKPKRGRPIGWRKIKLVPPTLLQLPKAQKIEKQVLGVQEPNADVQTNHVDFPKPKRGRPIGWRKIKLVPPTLLQLPKAQKIKKRVLGVQEPNSDVQTNHVDLPKPKRGRPKGWRKIKLVPPTLLHLPKAQKTEKQVLGAQESKADVQTNHVELPKPKRGRPKGFNLKKVVGLKIKIGSKIFMSKHMPRKVIKPVDLGPPKLKKRGRPKGFKLKKPEASVVAAVSNKDNEKSFVEPNPQQTSEVVLKPKRGRPIGLKVKKPDAPLVTVVSKDEKGHSEPNLQSNLKETSGLISFKLKKPDAPLVTLVTKEEKGHVEPNLQSNLKETSSLTSFKPKRGRPIGFKLKKRGRPKGFKVKRAETSVVTVKLQSLNTKAVEESSVERKTLDSVKDTPQLEPATHKRGRPKSLGPKDLKKGETVGLKLKETNGLEAPRPKSLEPKKVNFVEPNINSEASGAESCDNKNDRTINIDAVNVIVPGQHSVNKSTNLELPKPKRGRPKSLEPKKVIFSEPMSASQPSDIEKSRLEAIQLLVAMETKGLKLDKTKKNRNISLEAKKDVASTSKTDSVTFIPKKTNEEVVEIIQPQPTSSKRGRPKKSLGEITKMDVSVISDDEVPPKTELIDLSTVQLDSKNVVPSQTKTVQPMSLQAEKVKAVGTVIDLDAPKRKRGRPKGISPKKREVPIIKGNQGRPKKVNTKDTEDASEVIDLDTFKPKKLHVYLETTDLQTLKSKTTDKTEVKRKQQGNVVEIIDLNPSTSKKDELKVLQECPKPEKTESGSLGQKQGTASSSKEAGIPSRDKGTDKNTKEFVFARPTAVAPRVVSAFVPAKDTKTAKPEKTDGKVDEPSKQKVTAERKVMCTIGTQTLEDPEEVPAVNEPGVNDAANQGAVNSVGTQVADNPKLKILDIKTIGRKVSVSSVDGDRDLDVVVTKSRDVGTKTPSGSSMPKKPRVSESVGRRDQNHDEVVKVEDTNLNNSMVECQEIGVKYETVEQIHTEFKYESQSETEEMMKRRRGKHGGPMRGRKRGFNKMEDMKGQTTIDSFVRIVDLNGKLQLKIRNQIFKCDHCLYVGNSKANLERHSLLHRNPDEIIWFQCTECPYRSKYEHQLKSHFLVHKKPDEIEFFQCPHCEVKCSRKHNLNNHIKSIHADRTYSFQCAECPYTTFSKDRLGAHVKKHSKEVHACPLCKFVTKRQEYLESHFKMKHMEKVERPFPCDTCSYKGKTKRELDKHYDRMHNKDQLHVYQCNHCPFNSIYKKNLEFHLLHMHQNSEGFQKFICGHCNKTFSYKNGLKVHIIRCHIKLSDEDWHKCLECKYKSKDVATLKRHIKRNHGAPRLHCKQCSFATNRQMSMEAHVKTHEFDNEDILKCPECPYRILQMTSFLYHMKVIHGKPISSREAEQYYLQEQE